MQMFVNYSSAS